MGDYTKNLFSKRRKLKGPAEPVFDSAPLETEAVEPAAGGGRRKIKLWLDDERDPKDTWGDNHGFTVTKSYFEAMSLLRDEHVEVVEMSLDWHLGGSYGTPDGLVFIRDVIETMHLLDRDFVFANCKVANCHSSDRDRRVQMARVIQEAQTEGKFNKNARVRIMEAKRSW